jgi:hypothetical protein
LTAPPEAPRSTKAGGSGVAANAFKKSDNLSTNEAVTSFCIDFCRRKRNKTVALPTHLNSFRTCLYLSLLSIARMF